MEVPRIYETVGKEAVFLGAKTGEVLFLCDVLESFENDFGNKTLEEYVYMLLC